MMERWPETLTREQFINALEQFLVWLDEEALLFVAHAPDYAGWARGWVDHMDAIQPCWPGEEEA